MFKQVGFPTSSQPESPKDLTVQSYSGEKKTKDVVEQTFTKSPSLSVHDAKVEMYDRFHHLKVSQAKIRAVEKIEAFFPIKTVEKKLNIRFQNRTLLLTAFVHRSFWNENPTRVPEHNERLEFLGDSVLGLIVADYLFQKYPSMDEGSLTKLRSQLVDAPACAAYVQRLEISEFLLLGKGEQMNRGKGRETILSDLFEALIGAIYLDQGLEKVRQFFYTCFQEEVNQQIAKPVINWKGEFQVWAQKKFQEIPQYNVLEESGPDHRKEFRVGVWIQQRKYGEGRGSSKKEATIKAAEVAFLSISKHFP